MALEFEGFLSFRAQVPSPHPAIGGGGVDCVVVFIADSLDCGQFGGIYCTKEGAHFDVPDFDSLVVATGGEVLRAWGQGEISDG